MKKLVLAAVVGMVVYFLWGMLSWSVFQLHNTSLLPFPKHQDGTVHVFQEAIPESGVYYYPAEPNDLDNEQQLKSYEQRHTDGPIFTIYYMKEGQPVMDWRIFLKGAINYFVLSFLLAFLLQQVVEQLNSWVQRVLFVTVVGVIIALSSYVDNWIWFYHPLSYVMVMSLDLVIRWILLGIALAFIIKPERKYKVGSL